MAQAKAYPNHDKAGREKGHAKISSSTHYKGGKNYRKRNKDETGFCC